MGRPKGSKNKPRSFAKEAEVRLAQHRGRDARSRANALEDKLFHKNRKLLVEAQKAVRNGTAIPPLEAALAGIEAGFASGNVQLMLTAAAMALPFTNPRLLSAQITATRDDSIATEAELIEEMRQLQRKIELSERRKVRTIEAEPVEIESYQADGEA